MKKKILIVGSSGNLGSVLTPIISREYEVITPNRRELRSWLNLGVAGDSLSLQVSEDTRPDLILNLATRYVPNPSQAEIVKMKESIVQVSESLANANFFWRVPVIGVSSYFQFAPRKYQPWSIYSELKKAGSNLLRDSCVTAGTGYTEVVLYDNFGGKNKDKFFDLVIHSFKTGTELRTTLGYSLINLISIFNLAEGIKLIIDSILISTSGGSKVIGIYSKKTWTLRSLVQHVAEISGLQPRIAWGSLPYRNKEVFEDWVKPQLLPLWEEDEHAIDNYITQNLKQLKP